MSHSQDCSAASAVFSRAEEHFSHNEIRQALSLYEQALKLGLDPDCGALHRWMCYMLLGRFEEAWRETDRTEAIRRQANASQENVPLHLRRVWNGERLDEKCVFVRCYHGLGDTIQFIRYIPLLRHIARDVIIECEKKIAPLIRCADGVEAVVPLGSANPQVHFDAAIELMELAYAFRTRLIDIPCAVPYIKPGDHVAAPIANELTALEGRVRRCRVGLVWRGGSWNPLRSIPLNEVLELTKVEEVSFFSLQCGCDDQESLQSCSSSRLIRKFEFRDLLQTAGMIMNLDLVISVDTMAAHLAGALGRPVWTLLPYAADWRWMSGREDSPWYPTMRLYRQQRPGDWNSVLKRVTQDLEQFSANFRRSEVTSRSRHLLHQGSRSIGYGHQSQRFHRRAESMARHKLTKAEQEKGVERALESPKTPPQLKKGLQKRKKQLRGR